MSEIAASYSIKNSVNVYVFDLDGTLADDTHRKHYICNPDGLKKDIPNWSDYFNACGGDTPIEHNIFILKAIAHSNMKSSASDIESKIVILSARNDDVKDITVSWLKQHLSFAFYEIDDVILRPSASREEDYILKPAQLSNYLDTLKKEGYEPTVACIFEDRSRVVNAWRKLGYNCLQVSNSDF